MKLRDHWKLSVILYVGLLAGCVTAQNVNNPPMSQEQAQAFFDQYSELWMAEDLEGWLALWTDDGVQMPRRPASGLDSPRRCC